MTRSKAALPIDLHERFASWLLQGAVGMPSRDVSLHAAYCEGCQRATAALDALTVLDPGRAGMPPTSTDTARGRRGALVLMRVGAASVVVLLAAAGGAAAGSGLLPLPFGVGTPQDPVQQVLGGTGSPEASPTGSASPTPTATPVASSPSG